MSRYPVAVCKLCELRPTELPSRSRCSTCRLWEEHKARQAEEEQATLKMQIANETAWRAKNCVNCRTHKKVRCHAWCISCIALQG